MLANGLWCWPNSKITFCLWDLLGDHHSISRGGGGAGVFVAGKLFISTGLGGTLKISHFITCLYRTVLEVHFLFHAESARNYLFKKNSSPPPPLGIECWPPYKMRGRIQQLKSKCCLYQFVYSWAGWWNRSLQYEHNTEVHERAFLCISDNMMYTKYNNHTSLLGDLKGLFVTLRSGK